MSIDWVPVAKVVAPVQDQPTNVLVTDAVNETTGCEFHSTSPMSYSKHEVVFLKPLEPFLEL